MYKRDEQQVVLLWKWKNASNEPKDLKHMWKKFKAR